MDNSWLKLYRKLKDWQWYTTPFMVHLFIHLLISANTKTRKWGTLEIKEGQLVTGRHSLSVQTGISEQSIRTCLERLELTSEITIKPTNKYSVITILKYNDYQFVSTIPTSKVTSRLTNNQPATNHNIINKEYNNNIVVTDTPSITLEDSYKKQYEQWMKLPCLIENYGKCRKKANELIKSLGLEVCVDCVPLFFVKNDWYEKQGYNYWAFLNEINKLRIKL